MNKMKYFQRAAWLILAIQIVMLALELFTFQSARYHTQERAAPGNGS